MTFSPVPKYSFRKLTDISPDFLGRLGIRFLMLDLDNTIAAYREHSAPDSIARWAIEVKNCGVELFIVTNSARKDRVSTFAEALGAGMVTGARKPSPRNIILTMNKTGYGAGSSAFIGDQVFTDTIAANGAGVVSIIIKPRKLSNPFLALRYALEAPFRAMCKNRY